MPMPRLKQQWSAVLGPVSPRLRVGLAWAGRQHGELNHTRDIPLSHLRPLAEIEVELVSLQQQIPAGDLAELAQWGRMHRLEAAMTDMAETAALIDNLDLVISADTAVIHLAGALGKTAWLLLRYESEWRWGWQTGSSRWYPTVKGVPPATARRLVGRGGRGYGVSTAGGAQIGRWRR
jgi:ADP-heptose:LPS heptosyltransferase